jgi:hypothetical protein
MGEMTRKACQIVKNRNNSSKKYKSLKPEIKKNLKIVLNQHFLHTISLVAILWITSLIEITVKLLWNGCF